MINKQTFTSFWSNIKLRNRSIFIVLILILAIALYYNGSSGYSYAKKYLNLVEAKKIQEKDSIINQIKTVNKELESQLEYAKSDKVIINNFKDEFIKERKKNDSLQSIINSIPKRIYLKSSLDSIADYYKYQ